MKIRLFDWDRQALEGRTARLESVGHVVDSRLFDNSSLKSLPNEQAQAVVISLERRPSQARDVALVLRKTRATRYIPLVLVGGDEEKVQALRQLLPDATYTTWECLEEALVQAVANQPLDPVAPKSVFDQYLGTPLPKKLGIRHGMTVGLLNAPQDFFNTLGTLPEGVVVKAQPEEGCEVWLWFVTRRMEYEGQLAEVTMKVNHGSLWVCWPKQASGVPTDLTQPIVRAAGLAINWVDFKICAIDAVWTGLCFRRRK